MERDMVAKVKKETVLAYMNCPLCDKLLRDATAISECLHTFCRKCIDEKITEDEIECCPVCDIDLGGTPLEKLRPDHILQDLRAKLFPLKRKKDRAPELVSSITLPAKRKERSISSLVVSTPRVSAQAGTTGKRTKSATRKDVQGSGSFTKRTVKKEEEFGDDHTESASSPETLKKFTQNKRQINKMLNVVEKAFKELETVSGKIDARKEIKITYNRKKKRSTKTNVDLGLPLRLYSLGCEPESARSLNYHSKINLSERCGKSCWKSCVGPRS